MSIELATTQPVRQAGTPLASGIPRADELGWTLRERLWLTRAALGTMALSIVASLILIALLPAERVAAKGVLQAKLAERSLAPIDPIPAPIAPLPAAELKRVEPGLESLPAPIATVAEPPSLTSEERPLASKPNRRVVITRGRVSPYSLPAAPAVDLSQPQSLAPKRAEPQPVVEAAPPPPEKQGPELKRPSFE